MKKLVRMLVCSLPLIILAACGGGGGGSAPGAPGPEPTVVATTPSDGTVGVAASTTIKVTFSEAMDPTSVTASDAFIPGTAPLVGNHTFTVSYVADVQHSINAFGNFTTVTNKTFIVPGTVTADATNKIFTFTPTSPTGLTAFDFDQTTGLTLPTHAPRTFMVTIKGGASGVKEAGGVAMRFDKISSFTTWAGTQQSGTLYDDAVNGIGTDSDNNVYMAGYTKGSLGATNVGTVGQTADILLVKYDATGALVWTQQLGSEFDDQANGFTVDNSSGTPQLVTVGYTDGTLPGVPSGHGNPDTSGATHNYFVMKCDSDGNFVNGWQRQSETSTANIAHAVATDLNGNVYVTGETAGIIGSQAYAGGATDAFVAKYSSSGNLLWTRLLGTSGDDAAVGIAVDANSNIYLTGRTTGSFPGSANAGGNDVFVAKLNTSGNLLLVKQFGTSRDDHANAITVDSSGFVFVTGGTSGSLSGANADTTATAGTTSDLFVAKLDPTLSSVWIRQLGTPFNDDAFGVVTDAIGNVFVTGYTYGNLDGNINSGSSGADIFVVKYDRDGNKQWTKLLGSAQTDLGNVVVAFVGPNGTPQHPEEFLYVAGYTSGDLDSNFNMSGGATSGIYGPKDYFLAKFDAETGLKF